MEIIYTGESIPEKFSKSLFLAGPSLRADQTDLQSWREDALDILRDKGYTGLVFVPENKDGKFHEDFDYDTQVEWEDKHLNIADIILFWVPRDLSLGENKQPKLPAFTTNIEWGTWASSGKVVLGTPKDADKVDYLKHYAEKYNVPVAETLSETIENALEKLGEGAEREGGERFVPLFVWRRPSFQSWYQAQTKAGNSLREARLLFNFRPRYKDFVFLWVLHAKVYVASEDRVKDNEFVLARPDISSVCLHYIPENTFGREPLPEECEVVLVKEFRTPSSSEDGFVRELPSGSAPTNKDPLETASEEVLEETGFYLDSSRLRHIATRQLAGTFSAHKSHLFAARLDEEEIKWFKSQKGIVHGNTEDSEMTFIEVYTVKEILQNNLTDWTTIGEIFSALLT